MNLKEVISTNLIYLRKRRNLTLEQLADILSITRQGYANYELNTRDISVEYLKKLTEFYGVTLDLITSTTLIEGTQPIVNFNSLIYNPKSNSYIFKEEPLYIENVNSSILAIKIDDFNVKLFQSTYVNVEDHEMLFNYNGKIHIGRIYPNDNGNIIIINNKPTLLNKNQSKKLVILGILLANVEKEITSDNFL